MNYQISETFSFGIVGKNIGKEFDDGSYSTIDHMYGVGLSTLIPIGPLGATTFINVKLSSYHCDITILPQDNL